MASKEACECTYQETITCDTRTVRQLIIQHVKPSDTFPRCICYGSSISHFRIFVYSYLSYHVSCFVFCDGKTEVSGGGAATHNGKGKRCSKGLKKYLIDAGNLFGNCLQCLPSLFLPHSSAKGGGKDYSIHCVRFKSVIVRKIEIYKKDIRKESSGIVSRVANPSRV